MKKILAVLASAAILMSMSITVFADSTEPAATTDEAVTISEEIAAPVTSGDSQMTEPTVKVDGRTLMFREDQPPVILNDRTYVPLRRVLENMGATVKWDDATKTVQVDSYDNITRILLTVDNPEITVYTFTSVLNADERKVTSDVAPVIMNDRTMLPIRIIAESMGATVEWDDSAYVTTITTQQAKRYAKTKDIDSSADGFVLESAIGADLPKLSLVCDAPEQVQNDDIVTLKLKLDNLAANDENAKVFSVTASILYDNDNFAYDGFRCISDSGEIAPALSAANAEFADGCAKVISLFLPSNAFLPDSEGTIMEIDFKALNSKGGNFSLSDGISELGNNTEIITTSDGEAYVTLANYKELYIDTTPVIVK
ncbi:MAG: copper amine oxidase N-terminal domain-containing protein [Clostridiales bacterium]|nr:copper amine oxidase N-terminal domain-containing protein [Clostridiales bacterium]